MSFPRAVCLLYRRKTDGKILSVSRKDDHTKFGLPGGKVDPGESDEVALRREVKEELGVELPEDGKTIQWVFSAVCRGDVNYISTTYFMAEELPGDPNTKENIVIKYCDPEELIAGPFGEYNRNLFRAVGVEFKDA